MTQSPFCNPFSIIVEAFFPCPWPRAILFNLSDMFSSSARISRSLFGSDPDDRTKIRGVITVESLKHARRSNGGGWMNLWSRNSHMKSCIARSILSRLKHLRIQRRSRLDNWVNGSGNTCLWGSDESKISCHSTKCSPKVEGRLLPLALHLV